MDLEKVAEKAKSMMKKTEEPKGASSASSPEKEKTEDVKSVTKPVDNVNVSDKPKGDIEAQSKKDEEILSKKDEELDENQKTRKAELVKIKKDVEEKDKKNNVQKRFDELTAKIKTLEESNATTKAEKEAEAREKEALRSELDDIKKQISMTPQDKEKEDVEKSVIDLRKKFLDEDKSKPREQRREMTREELDEWALEDYEAVQEWITKRTLRRENDRQGVYQTKQAEKILSSQNESAKKVYIKYPELDISKRLNELKSQGKGEDEARDIVCKENPRFKVCYDEFKRDINKYLTSPNAPELLMQHMEKNYKPESEKPKADNTELESLKKELESLKAENSKLKGLDVGVNSTRQNDSQDEPEDDISKKQAILAKKLGLDPNKIKDRVEKRKLQGYEY